MGPRTKKGELRELDEIWKKKVKTRDNFMCQVCMKGVFGKNCQAHHIIPKQVRGMRWDVNNGITLCYQHHKVGIFSPHQNAIWFFCWLKTYRKDQLKHCLQWLPELASQKIKKNPNN